MDINGWLLSEVSVGKCQARGGLHAAHQCIRHAFARGYGCLILGAQARFLHLETGGSCAEVWNSEARSGDVRGAKDAFELLSKQRQPQQCWPKPQEW